MAKHIGIDLGTANTLAYIKGRGIVLNEPSVIAVNTRFNRVIAVGSDAKEMMGKTPVDISAYRPLKDGVIAEFEMSKLMLKTFIDRLSGNMRMLVRPDIVVCIPYGVTEVERMAAEDAALEAGARTVAVIEEPVAAALGSDINIKNPRGCLVVDIGGGTTEVAVLSCGGIVVSDSIRIAGDKMDEAIESHVRRKYGVLLGDAASKNVKTAIGSVHPLVDRGSITVTGRNASTGLPEAVTVSSKDTEEALKDIFEELSDAIRKTLVQTPPELSSDILDDGIVISGGGALIGGLDRLISEITGLRVRIAENPTESVIRGIGKVIEESESYESVLRYIKYK